MKMDIVLWYNPVLAQIAEAVTSFGPELAELSKNMIDTMKAHGGIGLSGNQVNVPMRIFVMQRQGMIFSKGTLTVCNPRISIEGPDHAMNEGCLSLPGIYNQVVRGTKVTMLYQDLTGTEQEIYLEDLEARIAQHEFDHLNGTMFFDRMSRQMRKATLREWEKKGGNL